MKYAPHAIFALIVATLLVGQRFGFEWAGGDGYRPQQGARVVGSDAWIRRGEWILTGDDERIKIKIGLTTEIAIDQNSDLALVDTDEGDLTVHLRRGRIYASGPLTINTNFTTTTISSGSISIVNYDFLETVSIAPLDAEAAVAINDGVPFVIQKPVSVHETPPVSVVEIPFDVTAASVADFYQWAM